MPLKRLTASLHSIQILISVSIAGKISIQTAQNIEMIAIIAP